MVVVVVVVTSVMAAMRATVYELLIGTCMIQTKHMNVSVFVVVRLVCTYAVGRYVLLVPTVPGGINKINIMIRTSRRYDISKYSILCKSRYILYLM